MVCKECGKEIPEGALYCESCGAPLEEPIVLKVSKEDIKRAEKEEKVKAKERAKLAAKNTVKQVPEKKHHPDFDGCFDFLRGSSDHECGRTYESGWQCDHRI